MLKNLTPHTMNLYNADKELIISILPEPVAARCSVTRDKIGEVDEVPVYVTRYGEVTGLPDGNGEDTYIVSLLVAQAVPERLDVLSPGELLRDEGGQPIGCIGLTK